MDDLTPRITPLATAVINDPTMPAGLFQSYARLFAAAWVSNFQRTEPLEFDSQLVPLLGVRRSQARQHLRALRFAKLLDWTTDGGNHYVIHFSGPPPPQAGLPRSRGNPRTRSNPRARGKSRVPDSVVGNVVDPQENLSEEIQQHQQPSAKMELIPEEWAAVQQAVRGWLLTAGVWTDVAERLARQVAENERRMQQQDGPRYLAGQADVLGWMAYCFAEREKNGIAQPAAVLAANLNANRRCPDEYRPAAVCSRCRCAEDFCECPDEPACSFPAEFLQRAFKTRKRYAISPQSMWGVCEICHAFPCQCP